MVEGVGSGILESGSHSSCVSSAVRSVSVEPAEWVSWLRCWGVDDVVACGFSAADSSSLRHVVLRSMPAS